MSWRLLVVAVLPIVIGCSDGIAPTPLAATSTSKARFTILPSATIHIVAGLDGSVFVPTAFNPSGFITG